MTDSAAIREHSPQSADEWSRYYDLRWRVLREPWIQPPGSERDELDSESIHVALWDSELPVAGGRLHFNSALEAQVRYMAVEPKWQGMELGSRILGLLETRALEAGARSIVLNAREEAVGFYLRHGYQVRGPAGLLFGSIPHLRMEKVLHP